MKIYNLTDNITYKQGFIAEHGLSFYFENGSDKILFDTGQSGIFLHNANQFGINISSIDKLIFSHGHYDHTGGFKTFYDNNSSSKIYLKNEALEEKYSKSTGKIRKIGFYHKNLLNNIEKRVNYVKENIEISENLYIITDIKKYENFENKNLFTKENDNFIEDSFIDELFLLNIDNDEINIITGCSHSGIINIIKNAIEFSGIDKIGFVIGGFHFKGRSEEEIDIITKKLNEFDIDKMVVTHCTGIDGYRYIKNAFQDRAIYLPCGESFEY